MSRLFRISTIVLIASFIFLVNRVRVLQEENERLSSNNTALMEQASFYQTEHNKSAASVMALTLSKQEVEKHCSDLTKTIRELNLKVNRLKAASSNSTKTEYIVKTIVKDSIVYVAGVPDTLQRFRWADSWTDIVGLINNKKLDLSIQSRDTLKQIIHRVPKKFLWFKFGTKAIRQDVVSSNPHTRIVYSDYIELK